ncbi:MAG: phosphate signaling complex protein PhoU [Candidatus Puniceispirillaceae bacterium]|jgi:phosphate transport system protein|nr:phosphate transport system regulatory protein PhoU [Alphaproteobacteria bacterium]NCW30984.1 phosphate transport system regulatory protein PhoU [Alphaproteobacteria bacterium]NDH26915.1 phosphate transport system regulatory protein PhoU [Paracoccaceae bacterium]
MDNSKHISSAFDQDLELLNDLLQELGLLASNQFDKAIEGLATQNDAILDTVITGDAALDKIEAEIHEKAIEIIAIRAPRAQDLRYVLVSLKIATILERMGDYARNIANRTRVLSELGNENIPGVNIGRMGHVTLEMVRDVMLSLKHNDAEMALKVWRRDVEVDHMHTAFYKEVLASMSRNPNMVATGAHLLFIAKNIERIGDYATGIAEQVHFLVRGHVPEEDRPKADRTSRVLGA